MTRVAIPVTSLPTSQDPVNVSSVTSSDPVNGMSITIPSGYLLVEMDNQAAGPVTITFETVGLYAGLEIEDVAMTLGSGTKKMAGPFEQRVVNIMASAGKINVDVGSAGVLFRAFSVEPA